MPNIEIKARFPDLAGAREKVGALGARHLGRRHQVDTYFRVPRGRLKLRESSLTGAQLIPYLRPDDVGPKLSEYLLLAVDEPALCKSLFERLLGIETVVEKDRDVWLVGNVRVHLDEVKGLGTFLELEAVYEQPTDEPAERVKVDRLLELFQITPDRLLAGSYRELMLSAQSRSEA